MLLLARCFEKPKNQKRVYGTPPFLRRLVKFSVLTLVLGMFTANILCFADLETTAILVCNISKLISIWSLGMTIRRYTASSTAGYS